MQTTLSGALNRAHRLRPRSQPRYAARAPALDKVCLLRRAFVMYSHQSIIGLATAIEEYVPMMIPIVNASANPLRTSPPNSTIDNTEIKVSPDVITVRESV